MIKRQLLILVLVALAIRFLMVQFLAEDFSITIRLFACGMIILIGAVVVLKQAAGVIEQTTEVLSSRTKLAGGLLQSLGTAFPDMVLGIVAALISLQARSTDMVSAINYAVIAASTTFGSNIYNIGHAAWCIFRQNTADKLQKKVAMFPFLRLDKIGGQVTPLAQHKIKISRKAIDTAMDGVNALTILTAFVAISMVIFGKIDGDPLGVPGDLYQLLRPVGWIIFAACLIILWLFRRGDGHKETIKEEKLEASENPLFSSSSLLVFIYLIAAGIAILLAAESMIRAIEVFTHITHVPVVVAGVLSGLIGCLGEMIVIHNFTTNPNGRLGDAVMGVAMDNIVTTMGASIVAIMGGIFLGGNALILIFVVILALNNTLSWQIAKLKNAI